MKLKPGNFIMYKENVTNCLEIVRIEGTVAYIRYWHLGFVGKPHLVSMDEFMFPMEGVDWSKWKLLTPADLTQPRSGAAKKFVHIGSV